MQCKKGSRKANRKTSHVDPIILCPRRSCFVFCPCLGCPISPMVWIAIELQGHIRPLYSWYEISLNKTRKNLSVPGNILKIEENPQFDMQKLMERTRAFLHLQGLDSLMHRRDRTQQKFRRFEITTPGYSGTLSSTLRFECTSDTSTSHKKQEAK